MDVKPCDKCRKNDLIVPANYSVVLSAEGVYAPHHWSQGLQYIAFICDNCRLDLIRDLL